MTREELLQQLQDVRQPRDMTLIGGGATGVDAAWHLRLQQLPGEKHR